MSNSKRPKAFFLNGGMGRIISAIPALEKYYEAKEDPDFIIVIEGICNIMNGHPTLDNKTYDMYHKNLFHTKLINMDIVSPEPYRLNEYFNQKCDIAQAFDMLINKKGIRELPAPTLILSKNKFRATNHRVLWNKKERMSVPFFFEPSFDFKMDKHFLNNKGSRDNNVEIYEKFLNKSLKKFIEYKR